MPPRSNSFQEPGLYENSAGCLPRLDIFEPGKRRGKDLLGDRIGIVGEHVLPDFERGQKIRDRGYGKFRNVANTPRAKATPAFRFRRPRKQIGQPNNLAPRQLR